MKREAKILDGTPNKRLFWSIIQDYSLETSICELVDNALDLYLRGKQETPVFIKIDLDGDRQLIRIEDNAGGVRESDLELLIRPGGTGNSRDEDVIGMFGVGSKRAVVALGENTIIRSRYENAKSFQIDIDSDWLESDSWDIPAYHIEPIAERTTKVEVSKLRRTISSEDEQILRDHLSATYGRYLASRKFQILLNRKTLSPITFEEWAYPPNFLPRDFKFELPTDEDQKLRVHIIGGLVRKRERGLDDYGVYFYCNDRLIAKELKDRSVGYISGKAGIPHSDASLCRVIVRIEGPAKFMPWNSTKSAIVYSHPTFMAIQDGLTEVVAEFSSLSRRLRDAWDTEVFAHQKGKPVPINVKNVQAIKRANLPPLPKVLKRRIDHLRDDNLKTIREQPWLVGSVEAVAAVELIIRQKFQTKNRIALILLDSTLEISFKDFLVHSPSITISDNALRKLFEVRSDVINEVQKVVTLDPAHVAKINHYYKLRNKMIHERATAIVTDEDIDIYSETVQYVLTQLFKLQF
jgi:hypothetical protein